MITKRHIQPLWFGIVLLLTVPLLVACQSNDEPTAPTAASPTANVALDEAGSESAVNPTVTADSEPAAETAETHTPEPHPTDVALDLCETAERVGGGGTLRGAAKPPSGSVLPRADSWVAFAGIEALAWSSHWIVQARIAAQCLDGELGFPENVIEVERTLRGTTREFMVVHAIGDRYGSRPQPVVGDEFVLFIDAEHWVMGGPQGSFYIENGLVGAEYGALALTPEEFAQAIAVALSGAEPENLPVPVVPLDSSPPGPDLPALPENRPAGCGGMLTPQAFQGRETLRLLWSSQHVFAGTVIEQLPSVRVDEPQLETDPLLRPVVTDFLVRIEHPIRGLPDDVIRIRRLGGEVDGCSVSNTEGQLLEVGQRALIFAWTPEPYSDDPTYYLNGSRDGFWRFADGEALAIQSGSEYSASTVVAMQPFADGLLAALHSGPPEDDGYGLPLVTLEAAPAAPAQAWPALLPDSSTTWVFFQHPTLGVGFDYPASWSIYEAADSGAISIANYETVGGAWESIPEGGLRIDLGPLTRPGYGSATPLSIGRDGLPGSIYFAGLFGDTYHVYITYEVAGQPWQIAGYFKEPADLDNPNTRLFFAIVASVAHDAA